VTGFLSQRVLPVLQLTRAALVFTAISNSLCEVLLLARHRAGFEGDYTRYVDPRQMSAVIVMSSAMYMFGMSLNDIIDRRRDAQISPHRPLPSGRIGVITAHVICAALCFIALGAGTWYALHAGTMTLATLALLFLTAALITFYDFAGKYLVAIGLITLGMVRFCHALIPAPQVPLVWHPLLLLNHVTILSAVCYQLEEKRPPLTRMHWLSVIGLLVAANVACILAVCWRIEHRFAERDFIEALWIRPPLLIPAGAVVAFILVAWVIRKRHPEPRAAGQTLMLYGLLWLIVYDASFVGAFVTLFAGLLTLVIFLPAAYVAVQLLRWWTRVYSLSQRPAFQRAR
jgi:hypothetical protein